MYTQHDFDPYYFRNLLPSKRIYKNKRPKHSRLFASFNIVKSLKN